MQLRHFTDLPHCLQDARPLADNLAAFICRAQVGMWAGEQQSKGTGDLWRMTQWHELTRSLIFFI
jgi:hypothetical protein